MPATPHGPLPVPGPSPAVSALAANQVSGMLVRMEGPRSMPEPLDRSKLACLVVGGLAALPIALLLALLWISVRASLNILALTMASGRRRSNPPSSGSWGPFVFLGTLWGKRSEQTVPVYHMVVNTASGVCMARQEGEFRSAQPLVGHEVMLHGRYRDGVLIVHRGRDQTLGVEFSRKRNLYAVLLPFVSAFLALEIVALLSLPR